MKTGTIRAGSRVRVAFGSKLGMTSVGVTEAVGPVYGVIPGSISGVSVGVGYGVTDSRGQGVGKVAFRVSFAPGTIGDQPLKVSFGATGVRFGSRTGVGGAVVETVVSGEEGGVVVIVVTTVVETGVDRVGDGVGLDVRDVVSISVGRGAGVRVLEACGVTEGVAVREAVGWREGPFVIVAVGAVVRAVTSIVGAPVVARAVTVAARDGAFETVGVGSMTGVVADCVDVSREGAGTEAWTAQRHTPIETRSRRTVLIRGLKGGSPERRTERGTRTGNSPMSC